MPNFFALIETATSTEPSQKDWGHLGLEEMDKEYSLANEVIQSQSKPMFRSDVDSSGKPLYVSPLESAVPS